MSVEVDLTPTRVRSRRRLRGASRIAAWFNGFESTTGDQLTFIETRHFGQIDLERSRSYIIDTSQVTAETTAPDVQTWHIRDFVGHALDVQPSSWRGVRRRDSERLLPGGTEWAIDAHSLTAWTSGEP